MTVESSINSLISSLKLISNDTRGQAVSLVQQAGAAFNGVTPPDLAPIQFDVGRTTTGAVRVPKPPSLSEIPAFETPEFSELQDITPFDAAFTATLPHLNLPKAVNTNLGSLPEFAEAAPENPVLTVQPDFSLASHEPGPPVLTAPLEFSVFPISGDPPQVPSPEFDEFTGDFFAEYQNGLALMAPDFGEFSAWLRQLYADVVTRLDGVFTTRMQAILQGVETAVPDGWATHRHTQVVQDLRSERQTALTALDSAPSSQTGLPTGARLAARLELELKTLRDTTKSASRTAVLRRELEVKHLQWAMQLCAQWVEAALALKAQEVGWRMKSFQLALDGATQALTLATKVLDTKEKEIAFIIRYNETQVERTQILVKQEKTKLTTLKAVLASNQLKATFNQNQLQAHQGALTLIEQRVRKYLTKIEYLTTQQQLEKSKLRIYEAKVKAFAANVAAFSAEQKALAARIKGDVALMEGELAKVRQYQAQIKVFEAEVAALSTTVMAQAAQNNGRLEAYNGILSGKLAELQAFDTTSRLAVMALIQGYEAEAAEMSLELSDQDLQDRVAMDNALREMHKDHTETILKMETYGLLFAQRQAESRVIAQGAGTVGGMATQAFSSLNSVGALEIVEGA